MKLKLLFFCVISFAYAHAEDIVSTAISDIHEKIALEHRILAENIFDLLTSGHSIDDVTTFLNKSHEHRYDNKKLISDLQNLLNKQYSKNDLINIIVNNKESEKFYAWKNFQSKLETFAILAAAIGALYLLYKFCKKGDAGIPLPFFDNKPQSSKSRITKAEKKPPQVKQEALAKKNTQSNYKRSNNRRLDNYRVKINYESRKALDQELEYARSIGAL